MCRLFGLIANRPVDVSFSFYEAPRSLRLQSLVHKDGWGIAWYETGSARVYKEVNALFESRSGHSVIRKVRSNIIIAHVRLKTCGERKIENTHPFVYRNFIFAHNGHIDRNWLDTVLEDEYKRRIVGDTDSERYFHLILQEADRHGGDLSAGIRSAVGMIIENCREYRGLNFVLSDGMRLYAFRYAPVDVYYYSLYYLERAPSHRALHTVSKQTRMLIESKAIAGERAVIISSERMTEDESWKEIPLGALVTVDSSLTPRLEEIL